jgi:Tfp pilus assembly protein PilN
MNPRPESRIKSLETRVTDIEAGIEELASDQAEGLRSIQQDIKKLDEGIKASCLGIGDALNEGFSNTEAIRQDVATIKAAMATKDDISRLETRIGQIETTQQRQEQLLQAILDRLPPKQ